VVGAVVGSPYLPAGVVSGVVVSFAEGVEVVFAGVAAGAPVVAVV